jgi:hypothetical protein
VARLAGIQAFIGPIAVYPWRRERHGGAVREGAGRIGFLTAVCMAFGGLVGCSAFASASPTPTISRPPAVPTPTRQVGFVVRVTVPPTLPAAHTPRPTSTPFVPPRHPYILLQPSSGPPVSRFVRLLGGNLPKRVPVDMVWAPKGHKSQLNTVIYTGPRGNIDVSYTVPMSAPGTYSLVAEISGRQVASATYNVASHATLEVSTAVVSNGESLVIRGHHFIPNFKLALVAYQTVGKSTPLVLGMAQSSKHGAFVFRTTTNKLTPGQYVLRSWSVSDLAAQMAETFFEVEV